MAKAGDVVDKMPLKSAISKIKALLNDRPYEDLIAVKDVVEDAISESLGKEISVGSKVTINGRGKGHKEVEVYGITKDYLILQDGDSILKKKYHFGDLIAIEGKHV